MKSPLEFWVFLPQMRLTMDQMVDRARAAEAAGFAGVAGMDHLTPPLAENQPMLEAMVTNTWLASKTEHLRVGSLVLCDSFRHPAVLAREAVSIDHASGGRFELGIGWGSVAGELGTFGVGSQEPKVRLGRLRESLEIITGALDRRDARLRGRAFQPARRAAGTRAPSGAFRSSSEGPARERCAWSPSTPTGGTCTPTSSTSSTRCGHWQETPAVHCKCRSHSSRPRRHVTRSKRRRVDVSDRLRSSAPRPELVEYFGSLQERGVERVYVWFCDFAALDTLSAFGDAVIGQLGPTTATS